MESSPVIVREVEVEEAADRKGALELLGSVDPSRHDFWWIWLGYR